jgi:hypothetical protein
MATKKKKEYEEVLERIQKGIGEKVRDSLITKSEDTVPAKPTESPRAYKRVGIEFLERAGRKSVKGAAKTTGELLNSTIRSTVKEDSNSKNEEKIKKAQKEYDEALKSGASDFTVASKLNALNQAKTGVTSEGWFKKGAFEDGYDFGDIARTILGTSQDIGSDLSTGALRIGEAAIDLGANVVAGGAKLLGKEDTYNEVKNFIARNLIEEHKLGEKVFNKLTGGVINGANELLNEGEYENGSILDEKADALVQSGGLLMGTAGLQAIGIPWFITMGTTGYAGGTEEAYQNGASFGEAQGYGAITGLSEILFERLTGGIKFGGKALSDTVVKKLTDGIADKATKTLTKFGIDAAGEGGEEVLTEIAQNVGKKLTYASEEDLKELLFSEEAMDGYLESFIGGAALGGGANVGKVGRAVRTGRDYDTGLSDNEQKVINTEVFRRATERQKDIAVKERVNQIIEEQEKTFGTLSQTERKKIQDQVLTKLDAGEIDYSEATLDKKEQAKIENEVMEDLVNGDIGIDAIESALVGEKTTQIKDLKKQLTNITDNVKKAEIEEKIGKLQQDVAQNMLGLLKKDYNLQETYRQEALKDEAFTHEITEGDSDITKELVESAKNANMNNTRKMHNLFSYVNRIANDTKTNYGFVNNEQLKQLGHEVEGVNINGLVRVNEDGTTKVLINVDSDKAINTIVGHETTHLLEDTTEYETLQNIVKEYATTKGEYDNKVLELTKLYEGTNADIKNEATADLVGDYLFTDEQFIRELSGKNPNVFKKIYDYIKHIYKMATAGSKEARELEKVKRSFDKAYKEVYKATKQGKETNLTAKRESNTKYHISEVFSEEIDKALNNEMSQNSQVKARDYTPAILVENGVKDLPMLITQRHAKTIIYSEAEARELGLPTGDKYNYHGLGKDLLIKSVDSMDNPLEIYKQDNDHYLIITDVKNNEGNNVIVPVKIDGKGTYNDIYIDENQILSVYGRKNLQSYLERNKFELVYKKDGTTLNPGVQFPDISNSVDDSISESETKSNAENSKKYSLSDSTGRQLTKEQAKRFKDSKVRDENGSLMVMYHGTPSGGYTVFKDGTYFTSNKEYADRYQNPSASSINTGKVADNPQTYEVYLDIKKPFDISDPEAREIYINDYIKGGNAMGINPYESDTFYSKINTIDWTEGEDLRDFLIENEYDYDGLVLDEGADGGYGGEVAYRGKSYVVFGPEQIKSVDNTNPTEDPDIRYSLSDSGRLVDSNNKEVILQASDVGTHGTLMAIRNIKEPELRGLISLGGLPSPSIAITDPNKVDHSNFGRISVLFDKETINPGNRKNEVYDRDVWSPRFPSLSYEVDDNKASELYARARSAGSVPLFNATNLAPQNIEDMIDREKGEAGLIERYRDDMGMKNFYLAETSTPVPVQISEKITKISQEEKEQFDFILEKMATGIAEADNMSGKEWNDLYGKKFKEVQREYWKQEIPSIEEHTLATLVDNQKPFKQVMLARKIREYMENGGRKVEQTEDLAATRKAIDEKIDQGEYNTWLANLFKGIEKSVGIYNGKDPYTSSGNRRSFKALHDDFTLENLVKNMTKGRTQGGENGFMGVSAGAISSNIAKKFKSIADIKANESRIKALADEMVTPLKEKLGESINALYPYYKGDYFNVFNSSTEAVFEFSTKKLTSENFKKILNEYNFDVNRIPVEILQEVINDLNSLKDIPTDYFEAKPQRAVGLDEIKAMVIPNDTDATLKQELTDYGFYVIEYDPNIEGDRQNKINQFDDLKFSLSNPNNIVPIRGRGIYSQDVKLREDIAPIREDVGSAIEGIAPIRDDIAPIRIRTAPEDIAPIREGAAPAEEMAQELAEADLPRKTRKELRRALIEIGKDDIDKAMANAKDLSKLSMNNMDTIRVTERVFGREAGQKLNNLIFQKAIDNEADSIKWQNQERNEIKTFGIKAKTKESAAVQKWGEGKYLNDEGDYVVYDDQSLAREFPDIKDQDKIKYAAKEIKKKYDNYLELANNVLTDLGFEPIPKRDDYMRHFQELTDVFSRNGIPFNAQNMQEHVLPTDINGLTEFWSPQKNYFSSAQPRKGLRTTLDAIAGVDGYISGIANLIYHTEDIQRGRAFEEYVREIYGEKSGFDKLEGLSEQEQKKRIKQIQDNHLSAYAAWIHEWTNNLAGKKNKLDRAIEETFGRKGFAFLDEMRKQTSATMIGYNVPSSLTNLIAPVQAMAKTNKAAVFKGTADSIKNIFIRDNFESKNRFLISRMGTDAISQTRWEKVRNTGFLFMKGIDWFASNQIVRSKYYELRSKGLTEDQAHAQAGQFAARIMGDRTKGATPQLYNSKLFNMVAQFQLEVNNQLYSMFYDTYHESKEAAQKSAFKTTAKMTFTLGQLFALTHVFGKTFEALAGYNPTFDVIEILMTALGAGDDDDDKSTSERLKEAADMLVDALPYVNLFTDGGRIPMSSAVPNLVGVMTGGEDQYGNELTLSGEVKKVIPFLAPVGGNQIKKTINGLKMFDDNLPVAGSYTDSGNLRFPIEDNIQNRVQAGIFGQWANKNAREYFDNERKPLKEKQIEEYKELNLPISDYWKYREELAKKKKTADKIDYIASLDLPVSKKNIMANNVANNEEKLDLTDYKDYGSFEEFHYAVKNPDNYLIAKATGGYSNYKRHSQVLSNMKADKDENGKTISGSKKEKVVNYINSSDMDYGAKLIMYKSQYPSDDTYNYEIIDYLNDSRDFSYSDIKTILRKLGFTVDSNGNISWN